MNGHSAQASYKSSVSDVPQASYFCSEGTNDS